MNTNLGASVAPSQVGRNVPGEIRLHFRPERTIINATREYVRRFYAGTLASSAASWRVALTTHELLENALKYSTDGLATVEIVVVYGAAENTVRIRIHNRTSHDRLTDLRQSVDVLRASTNPSALYCELMERSIMRTQGSGLGLARIRAEAQMDLACEIGDDEVTMVAEGAVAPGEV